jgi:predicted MFS family arabinose efflux permease
MIRRGTVACLGLSQLVSWGISYYLIGLFGDSIATDLRWTSDVVYGGFAWALLVMGLTSPLVGWTIDRRGGRTVMVAGSLLNALGCVGLALCTGPKAYYVAWTCIGLGMRLTLYDAAFAALARIGGPQARGPMSQITFVGGLASTVFWPLGQALADAFGWRGALLAYAGFALLTVPLHMAIPDIRYDEIAPSHGESPRAPLTTSRRDIVLIGGLYAIIVTVANFLNAAMSSHMIPILSGLGVAGALAVWISTLRGIGQSLARGAEVLFGRHLNPLSLCLAACTLLPFAFVAGLLSGRSEVAAMVFAFAYGAANGLLTIVRGTLPLALFDHRTYGTFVGKLLIPGFILPAAAPLAYALIIARFKSAGALYFSIAAALLAFASAALLVIKFVHRLESKVPRRSGKVLTP